MKQSSILCILLLLGLSGFSQKQSLSSLKQGLETANDSIKLRTLLEIADRYQKKSRFEPGQHHLLEEAYDYASQAKTLAISHQDTIGLLEGLRLVLWYHRRKRERSKALDTRREIQLIKAHYGYDIETLNKKRNHFDPSYHQKLYEECWIYHDSMNISNIDSLLRNPEMFRTQEEVISQIPHLSRYSGSVWMRIKIRNSGLRSSVATFFLNRNKRTWQHINVFLVEKDLSYSHLQTGAGLPDSLKNMPETSSHFQVYVPGKEDLFLLVQLRGIDPQYPPTDLSITHVDYYQVLKDASKRKHINGIFQGVILIQFLFFLLLFYTTRDWDYGYYSIYIGGLTIFTLTLNYYMNFSLNQRISPLILYMIGIWMATVGILRFSSSYLQLDQILPKWRQPLRIFLQVFTLLCFVFLIFGIFLRPSSLNNMESFSAILIFGILSGLITLMILAAVAFLIVWGVQALRKNYDPARYYLIASFFLLLAIIIPIILSVIESSNPALFPWFSSETLITVFQAGVVLQLSCFALAVGHKRNVLVKSQKEALTQKLELQQRINAAAEKFVPYEFLTSLGRDSILGVNLGDQVEKDGTVFFADIRDYTTMSETMTPKENFRFLNAYLGRVGPIIQANRGFVNQYYGDGIMALFMSSDPEVCSCRDAIETAIEVQRVIQEYSSTRLQKGRLPLRIGIGIHTGPLMLGVLGDETRMDAGVVSDAVNTASRMEGLTKHFGASILASETTLFGIDNPKDFRYRLLGLALVKGKQDPLSVYEFFDGDSVELANLKAETLSMFEEGLTAYFAKEFKLARTLFEQVRSANPHDYVARLYMKRCQDLIIKGTPQGWTGVEIW